MSSKYKDPTMASAIANAKEWWRGIWSGETKFIPGLPLTADFIPAFIPGHVILVTGYTSAGKSQFLSQLIKHLAGDVGADTIVFSLEDSQQEKLFSIASVESEYVHKKEMILGTHRHSEGTINKVLDDISFWPLLIYDDVRSLPDMRDIILKSRPKAVILDYIQKVKAHGKIFDRMSYAADETYDMAQQLGFTFFIASQIDGNSAKEDKGIFIASKGAGDLVEAAHSVIQLKKGRKEDNKREVIIEIKKNKAFGNIGSIESEFNEHWTAIEKIS